MALRSVEDNLSAVAVKRVMHEGIYLLQVAQQQIRKQKLLYNSTMMAFTEIQWDFLYTKGVRWEDPCILYTQNLLNVAPFFILDLWGISSLENNDKVDQNIPFRVSQEQYSKQDMRRMGDVWMRQWEPDSCWLCQSAN